MYQEGTHERTGYMLRKGTHAMEKYGYTFTEEELIALEGKVDDFEDIKQAENLKKKQRTNKNDPAR